MALLCLSVPRRRGLKQKENLCRPGCGWRCGRPPGMSTAPRVKHKEGRPLQVWRGSPGLDKGTFHSEGCHAAPRAYLRTLNGDIKTSRSPLGF